MPEHITDTSGWVATAGNYRSHPKLTGNQTTDWAIIGAGFSGLAAARRLAELHPQDRIVLLDGKRIGQGATGRNSGFVVANESPDHATLASLDARATYDALRTLDCAGVARLKSLVQDHEIACAWEDTPSIHAAANPRNFARLRAHATAFDAMGIDATVLEADQLAARLGTEFYGLGVQSRGGALVQPAALAKGLSETLPAPVEIFEQTPVLDIDPNGTLTLEQGRLKAAKVIVAVNAFLPRLGLYRRRVFPLALSASLTRPLTTSEENEIAQARSWGILSPRALGGTLRLTQDRRLMIRNTVEYRPGGLGDSDLAVRRRVHVAALQERFPWLPADSIAYTWSGNIAVSRNSRPAFAAVSPCVFATGCYNAAGVARGTIMGELIVDLASHAPSALLDAALSLAPPSRMPAPPLMGAGIRARMLFERYAARGEN